jgi:hypothetical protein
MRFPREALIGRTIELQAAAAAAAAARDQISLFSHFLLFSSSPA